MSILEDSNKSSHFIHFGCWNQGNCSDEGTNPVSRVMQKLKKYVKHTEPNFLIVAGDNYYPTKKGKGVEKKKLINNNDLDSGFNCLPKDIPIYLLLGNHDLDNGGGLMLLSESNEETVPESCHILNRENEIVSILGINRPKNQGKKLVMYALGDNTLFLMIDTTMYDMKPNKPNDSIICYDKEINENSSSNSVPELMALQVAEVESILDEIEIHIPIIKYVVISGHHPLVYLKVKTEIIQSYLSNAYSLFYNTIFTRLNSNPSILYYYLCADLHNYQVGDIILKTTDETSKEMIIHQEIVGTGGTKLDMLVPENKINKQPISKETEDGFTVTYSMTKNRGGYGFIDCNILEDKIVFSFIHSDNKKLTLTITKSLLSKKGGKRTRKRNKKSI